MHDINKEGRIWMRKEDWKQSIWNRGWDHCYGWKVEWKVDRAQVEEEEEEEEEEEATSQLVTANNLTHTCSHSAQKRVEDAVHSVHRTALILNNRFTLKWTNIWKQSGKTNQENNNHVSKVNNRENVKDFKLNFSVTSLVELYSKRKRFNEPKQIRCGKKGRPLQGRILIEFWASHAI